MIILCFLNLAKLTGIERPNDTSTKRVESQAVKAPGADKPSDRVPQEETLRTAVNKLQLNGVIVCDEIKEGVPYYKLLSDINDSFSILHIGRNHLILVNRERSLVAKIVFGDRSINYPYTIEKYRELENQIPLSGSKIAFPVKIINFYSQFGERIAVVQIQPFLGIDGRIFVLQKIKTPLELIAYILQVIDILKKLISTNIVFTDLKLANTTVTEQGNVHLVDPESLLDISRPIEEIESSHFFSQELFSLTPKYAASVAMGSIIAFVIDAIDTFLGSNPSHAWLASYVTHLSGLSIKTLFEGIELGDVTLIVGRFLKKLNELLAILQKAQGEAEKNASSAKEA